MFDLMSLLFAFIFGLVFTLVFGRFVFVKQDIINIPHGSMGWPLLGETIQFLKPHKSNIMGSFLQEHCNRYGKVFRSHLFGSPTIISCDQEMNIFILQNEERLFQCSYPKTIRKILGDLSMIVVFGDVHKRIRSCALGYTSTCKSNVEFLYDIQKFMVSIFDSWGNIKEILFFEESKKLSFNIMVNQILSLEPDDPQVPAILESFHTFMKGLISFPLYIPGTPYAKAVKARTRIYSTVKTLMRKRKAETGPQKRDYLNVILSDANLNEEERVSVVLDLLLAGYETTAILMAMAVYFLAKSASALEKLKEEHQAIKEKKAYGEPLNWEDYERMKFTQNVMNEALRCGNTVKFLHRKALKDVNYKGYIIPAGWKVLPMIAAVNLDPFQYENPSDFNPWRWNEENTKRFNPFGGGLRLCPGADLAKIETAFFLHHLVLNFRWRLLETDDPYAFPYIEFPKGLPIEIQRIDNDRG